jgi:histidinol-phosphate aminotransferase
MHRMHGGPDALGVPKYDFSTNSNACGPCPEALQLVRQADATRYPDAGYHGLRERLAAFQGVAPERIVLAGSASEFIFRITALAVGRGIRSVRVPHHAYGDYRHAAQAWGLAVEEAPVEPDAAGSLPYLSWACDPSSPLGDSHAGLQEWAGGFAQDQSIKVLDRAYEPLRLDGSLGLSSGALDTVWQLYSPNKALGLTGVRAAYAVAPAASRKDVQALESLCPSWPVGAHGVAMLESWCEPAVQGWLLETRSTLRDWKVRQQSLCSRLGWRALASHANFFCVESADPEHDLTRAVSYLRGHGIKVRDTTSFGLPRHLRVAVLPPRAQDALSRAWDHWLAASDRPGKFSNDQL